MKHLSLLSVALLLATGCGNAVDAGKIATSEASVEFGLSQLEAGNWAEAEKSLSAATAKGGLTPDLAETALRSLATCQIHLEKTAEAESTLSQLEQGAAEMDLFWIAKAHLAKVKGDTAAAKEALAKARSFNRKVIVPEVLNGL